MPKITDFFKRAPKKSSTPKKATPIQADSKKRKRRLLEKAQDDEDDIVIHNKRKKIVIMDSDSDDEAKSPPKLREAKTNIKKQKSKSPLKKKIPTKKKTPKKSKTPKKVRSPSKLKRSSAKKKQKTPCKKKEGETSEKTPVKKPTSKPENISTPKNSSQKKDPVSVKKTPQVEQSDYFGSTKDTEKFKSDLATKSKYFGGSQPKKSVNLKPAAPEPVKTVQDETDTKEAEETPVPTPAKEDVQETVPPESQETVVPDSQECVNSQEVALEIVEKQPPKKKEVKKDIPQKRAGDKPVDEPPKKKQKKEMTTEQKANFRKFLQRKDEPPNKGKKPPPVGAAMCLDGYRFCITGMLDSLTREDCRDLIMEYGGKVTSGISGMTAYLIAGTEPGVSKIAKAKEKKVKIIDEDELFNLIETLPEGKKNRRNGKQNQKRKVQRMKIQQQNTSKAKGPRQKLWVEKYKPQRISDLIGNASHVKTIRNYLTNWPNNVSRNAVLLSGPPGIGKTSSAAIIARELGYEVLEMNASDVRSKTQLEAQVAHVVHNHGIKEYTTSTSKVRKTSKTGKQVLVMDEVDGMSSGDRGGVPALISFIKKTKIPIICICNDRQHQKMRSLSTHCIDCRFRRPNANQAWPRISQICKIEGIRIDQPAFTKMFEGVNGDIRQAINNLQIWSHDSQSLDFRTVKKRMETCQKDSNATHWDVAPKFFSGWNKPWWEQIDWYFTDRSLIPLMVEQAYPLCNGVKLVNLCNASEAFADGAMIDDYIMKTQGNAWSLAPLHGMLACSRPCGILKGRLGSRVGFPQQLGKIGKGNRLRASLVETYHNIECKTTCQFTEFRIHMMPILNEMLHKSLSAAAENSAKKADHLQDAVTLLKNYHLSFSDFDFMLDLDNPTRTVKLSDLDKKIVKEFRKLCDVELENNVKPEDFKPKKMKVKKAPAKKAKKKAATKKAKNSPKKKATPKKKKKKDAKQGTLGFFSKSRKVKRKLPKD